MLENKKILISLKKRIKNKKDEKKHQHQQQQNAITKHYTKVITKQTFLVYKVKYRKILIFSNRNTKKKNTIKGKRKNSAGFCCCCCCPMLFLTQTNEKKNIFIFDTQTTPKILRRKGNIYINKSIKDIPL